MEQSCKYMYISSKSRTDTSFNSRTSEDLINFKVVLICMNLILAYRVYDNLYCVYLSHDSSKNQIIFSGYPASFISNQLSQNFSVRDWSKHIFKGLCLQHQRPSNVQPIIISELRPKFCNGWYFNIPKKYTNT